MSTAKKISPFDYVRAINDHKTVDDFSGYTPYVVNKAFSYFIDTTVQANEMNMLPGLTPEMQFDFLFHTIRPMKRFSKWNKKMSEDEDLPLIMEYFKVNKNIAKDYKCFLSEEELDYIRTMKGGKVND